MLNLNIKSSSYMCLDIDPGSVIHKHLVKKTKSTNVEEHCFAQQEIFYHSKILQYGDCPNSTPSHNLTMLPRFHISLGAPPSYADHLMVTDDKIKVHKKLKSEVNDIIKKICQLNIVPIIGDITLAPICISKKDNKKSAWIPLHPYWLDQILSNNALNLDDFDSFDHRCDECPVQHLHVSVANLTGKPRDSIARPEDCIVDTIYN